MGERGAEDVVRARFGAGWVDVNFVRCIEGAFFACFCDEPLGRPLPRGAGGEGSCVP